MTYIETFHAIYTVFTSFSEVPRFARLKKTSASLSLGRRMEEGTSDVGMALHSVEALGYEARDPETIIEFIECVANLPLEFRAKIATINFRLNIALNSPEPMRDESFIALLSWFLGGKYREDFAPVHAINKSLMRLAIQQITAGTLTDTSRALTMMLVRSTIATDKLTKIYVETIVEQIADPKELDSGNEKKTTTA